MAEDAKAKQRLEISHVLFVYIVCYSKPLISPQSEILRELTEIISNTRQFRAAYETVELVRLPTSDVIALVFRCHPEAPAQCAMEISKALKSRPNLHLRM